MLFRIGAREAGPRQHRGKRVGILNEIIDRAPNSIPQGYIYFAVRQNSFALAYWLTCVIADFVN